MSLKTLNKLNCYCFIVKSCKDTLHKDFLSIFLVSRVSSHTMFSLPGAKGNIVHERIAKAQALILRLGEVTPGLSCGIYVVPFAYDSQRCLLELLFTERSAFL